MSEDWTLAAALGMTGVASRTYRVFVRNLIVPCRIGIYDYEMKAAQTQSTKIATELKSGISSSLEDLKKRFVEISESWRNDLEKTIKASEGAAVARRSARASSPRS